MSDDVKKRFVTLQRTTEQLLGALLPDPPALEFLRLVSVLRNVGERIARLEPAPTCRVGHFMWSTCIRQVMGAY